MNSGFAVLFRPSVSAKRRLYLFGLVLAGLAIFWICTFKIMDRDFWWHVKAGEILLRTRTMILIDPFAYTREGLPYLATHEWLAQIMLYIVYHLGGSTGIILFRGLIACACIGLLLQLTRQKRFVYLLLGIWAITITKGSFLERPQLFTFLLFASFILLGFRFLDAESPRARRRICVAFVGLEFLWVNMHGGAALLGCAVASFLFLQTAIHFLAGRQRKENIRTLRLLFITLVCMAIALVLPPNGLDTITYLSQLLSDKTIAFIAEWQPRAWSLYIKELWPFFLLSCAALALGRKHAVFNGLLLLSTAYLSTQAFRHEILFVFAAVATCFYQIERSHRLDSLWSWWSHRPKSAAALFAIAVLLMGHLTYERSFAFERQDNLFGFGQFDLARGAYDFIEREQITGNMFNTYGIGGYLIHRGYPERKVFIDGRNVDYGFEFMAHAYAAGVNADRWEELEHLYGITYALIDYDAIKHADTLPYSSILDTDPDWALVYVDDWVAVYLKKTAENQAAIDRLHYKLVTATKLQFGNGFAETAAADMPAVISELRRIQNDNLEGIKATLALAKIALRENRIEDMKVLLNTAMQTRPQDPEPIALLAALYISEEKWEEAAQAYERVLELAGDNYPNIDYGYIADIFEKAGHSWKAWYYRQRVAEPVSPARSGSGQLPSLAVNPVADAQVFQDQGLVHVEKGQLTEAEESFRTAIKINPSYAEAWNNLCALLLSQDRNTEALEACRKAVEIYDEYADAHYNLALALLRSSELDEAETSALAAKKWGLTTQADELLTIIENRQP